MVCFIRIKSEMNYNTIRGVNEKAWATSIIFELVPKLFHREIN